MRLLSKISFVVLMMFVSMSSMAQSVRLEDKDTEGIRPFVSVQGGATRSFIEDGVDRKWAPMGAISLGAYFTPAIGARIQADGWGWKQFNNVVGYDYKNRFIGGNADLLLNLSNFVNPNYNKFLNVVLLGGFGLQYATTKYSGDVPLGKDKNERLSPNLRFGGQLDLQFVHNLSLLLEGGGQMVLDNYGRSCTSGKVWPYAMAGLAFKFGKKKAKVAPVSTPVVQETLEDQSAYTAPAKPVVAEKKPVVRKAPAKITENVFFGLRETELSEAQKAVVERVAQWAQENPAAQIVLTGYADKGTGTAPINQTYSEKRVDTVKAALVKLGVAESRISSSAKGDTAQPFAENDQNRVVIVIGEEK